jgi:hypothetical protein
MVKTNKFNFYHHVLNKTNFDLMVESFASQVVLDEQPILTNFHRLILIPQSLFDLGKMIIIGQE